VTNTTPAVIIGAELNGLGVVRSLARGSMPTILVDTTRKRAAMWSRFTRAVVLEQLHGRRLVDGLLAMQKKLGSRPVLILTDALAVNTVSENRDELLGAYKFHLPPRNIVAMLQNKARFQEFAEQHDLPVPRTIIVKPDTPLAKLSTLPFPVIVKSAERRVSILGETKHVQFAATLRDAENICRRLLESSDELVVQEWIDGPDSNICFSLFYLGHKPENFKIFVGRKLASNPAKVGNAALCLAAPEVMDALEPLIAKFLDLAEFRGLGKLEFKWDAQQRRYVIIGATVGRTDWQEEIATLSGVNLPLAAYRDEVGLPPIPSTAIDRTVAWRESALLGNELPMLSPGMRIYDGYWRLNDPLPGVFFYSHDALEWIFLHIVKPVLENGKTRHMHLVLARAYQNLVKSIFHRGRTSAP
jgi:predicted ATP-grasp superfamily ATP-dependent carboligase